VIDSNITIDDSSPERRIALQEAASVLSSLSGFWDEVLGNGSSNQAEKKEDT